MGRHRWLSIKVELLSGSESDGADASANGAVVVGQARDKSEFWRAFRWTASTGMQDLGSLGGPIARLRRLRQRLGDRGPGVDQQLIGVRGRVPVDDEESGCRT